MYLKLQKIFSNKRGLTILGKLALAITLMFSYSSAHAIPTTFTYDPTNSSAVLTDLTGFCINCDPQVTVSQQPISFTLDNIGDSSSFDFLNLVFPPALGSGSANIAATLAFSTPSNGGSSTGSGTASGSSLSFGRFTLGSTGEVVWDNFQPGNIIFDDGTEVSLNFAGGGASCGIFGGGSCGPTLTATLAATTTLQAVPEPSLLALLGAGVLAFGSVTRRKKKQA